MRKDVENEILKYRWEVNLLNKSELARRMGCSRNTVSSKINNLNKRDTNVGKRFYHSILDEYKDLIKVKVEQYACSAKSIYLLLKNKYEYTGSYSLIAKYVSGFKQKEQVKVTIRFETVPWLSISS